MPKVTPEQVEAIKNDTRSRRKIADEYGISEGMVRNIKQGLVTGKGKSWDNRREHKKDYTK